MLPHSDLDQLAIGSTLAGRFLIQRRLASGGMGTIYGAEQLPLGRQVAIKVLRDTPQARVHQFAARFLREAAAVAKLNHPNTITVYDYGQDGDHLYFAMEFVDGLTLKEEVELKGPFTEALAARVLDQIAASIEDAHAHGLIHRDLKPGNVMIFHRGAEPRVKVLDFGLVKALEGEEKKLTNKGILLGSPRYMSPEQVKGDPVDGRADIYSLGAIAMYLLTGCPPFDAETQFEAMRAQVYTRAPTLSERAGGMAFSREVEALVQRCMEKDPAARFQTMTELRQALAFFLGPAASIHPPPKIEREEVAPMAATLAAIPEESQPLAAPSLAQSTRLSLPSPILHDDSDVTYQVSQAAQEWPKPAIRGVFVAALLILVGSGSAIGWWVWRARAVPVVPAVEPSMTAVEAPAPDTPDPRSEEAPPAAQEDAVNVRLQSSPSAQVFEGEVLLGATPLTIEVSTPIALTLHARGYRTAEVELTGAEPEVQLRLQRAGRSDPAMASQTRETQPPQTQQPVIEHVQTTQAEANVPDPWSP